MTLQYSVAVRNAKLDAVETAIGTTPILEIWSGTLPANCAAADAGDGDVLATLNLPSDWMDDADAGSKAMAGTWEDSSADADGTASHFRIKDSTGTTCHAQGTVTGTGGGGDMILDNTNFATGQAFSVTGFTLTAGNS